MSRNIKLAGLLFQCIVSILRVLTFLCEKGKADPVTGRGGVEG
jgi:hypothetical protein